MELQTWLNRRQSRRAALKQLGGLAAGAAFALNTGLSSIASAATAFAKSNSNPIDHILIACQENRSFDEYFGFYPKAGKYGVPPGYSLPDGNGGHIKPYHFPSPITPDVSHSWTDSHSEWNKGKMDGFYTTDGIWAIGFYSSSDLQYYYSLADHYTLCGNYHCYELGPTFPNRIALMSGTCGGNTSNSISQGSLDWPTIADVLDAHNISWKCYNLGTGTGSIEGFNGLSYFKQWVSDPRLYIPEADYYLDLALGTLPQVSFFIPEAVVSEHPPADIQWGQEKMQDIITALQQSSSWRSSAFFLTYDERGGYFDHVAPTEVDAYGMGFRVPMLVISPHAKKGHISGHLYDHSSVLKFIERRFNLPTLASINHQFDKRTPGANNDAAHGHKYGPPAPPRDRLSQIGDLYEVFNF